MSRDFTKDGEAGLLASKTKISGLLAEAAVPLINTYGNFTAISVPEFPEPISAVPRTCGEAQLPVAVSAAQPPNSGAAGTQYATVGGRPVAG